MISEITESSSNSSSNENNSDNSSINEESLLNNSLNKNDLIFKKDFGLIPEEFEINFQDLYVEKDIGIGSFGKVMKGSYFGTPVAIKQLLNPQDKLIKKYIQREVAAFKNIHHPNVVQFMGICYYKGEIFIVTEFIDGGDLGSLLANKNVDFTWKIIAQVCYETAQAMAYLHARNIIHRDLKCANLLVTDNWHIKVCDLGMARKKKNSHQMASMTICGTDEYMAPEVILGEEYNEKADIFSFGMCLYEMITRKIPKERNAKNQFSFNEKEFQQSCPKNTPPRIYNLTISCTRLEPSLRPSFKEILNILKILMNEVTDDIIDYSFLFGEKQLSNKNTKKVSISELKLLVENLGKEILIEKSKISLENNNNNNNNNNENEKENKNSKLSQKESQIGKSKSINNIKIGEVITSSLNIKKKENEEIQSNEPIRRNTIASPIIYDKKTSLKISKQFIPPPPSPIHVACSQGDLESLKRFLEMEIEPILGLDEVDRNGETPLFLAVKYSHIEIIKFILNITKKSVNIPNKMGIFPIHVATKNSNIEIVDILLKAGAKAKVSDQSKNYPLHTAIEMGNIPLVQLFLEKGGPTLLETVNDKGETPLLLCFRLGHDPIIPLLLQAGANLLTIDRQGKTPLLYVAQRGQLSIAEDLIKAGAEIDHVTEDGCTPLFYAVKEGYLSLALLLVKNGADLSRYRKHSLGTTAEFRKALLDAVPKKHNN